MFAILPKIHNKNSDHQLLLSSSLQQIKFPTDETMAWDWWWMRISRMINDFDENSLDQNY